MSDIDVLLAERAITRVLYRYAQGVDRRQYAQIRSCYWDDGHDDHMTFSGSARDYCDWLEVVLPKTDASTHQFNNVLIDIDLANDRATSEAYCLATIVWGPEADGTARHHLSALRYQDRWQRRAGEWRIFRRTVVADWRRVEVVTGE